LSTNVNQLTKETKLFFLHIPKTAGTSLRSYLIDQYHEKDVLQKYDWLSLNSTDIDELQKYNLIMGHFDYRMVGLLPPGYKIATFLREPIARTVSAIHHAMRDPSFRPAQLDLEGKTLKEIIRNPDVMKWFANTQVSLLAADCPQKLIVEDYVQRKTMTDPLHFMNDATFDLELACVRLKHLDFVGIVEQFDQGLLRLADLCSFYPPSAAPLLNNMPRDVSLRLDDEDMAILAEQNALDIALYQQALEISASQTPLQRDASLRKYFSLRSPIASNAQIDLAPPFSGWGFYKYQQSNDITYRWSGPFNNSGFSIKLAQGCCKLKFKYYLDAKQFAQSVEIFIGDHKPEAKVWKEMGYHYCEFSLDIADSNGEMIEFIFKTDRTVSPSTWGDQDLRSLGFMLVGFDIGYEANLTLAQPVKEALKTNQVTNESLGKKEKKMSFDVVVVADGLRISLGVALNMLISQKSCPDARFNVAIPEGSSFGSDVAEEIIKKYATSIFTIPAPQINIEDKVYRIENKINALRFFGPQQAILADSDLIFLRPLPHEYLFRPVPAAVSEHGKHIFPWERLYSTIGLQYPKTKVLAASGEVGEPWLNAGFVTCPNAESLGHVWRMISEFVVRCEWVPERWPYLDQISLPLAIALLSPEKTVGYESVLPDGFNQNMFYWLANQGYVSTGFVAHHHNRVRLIEKYFQSVITWIRDDYPMIDNVIEELKAFDCDDKFGHYDKI